jgi:multidrug resistance efflux pump
VSGTLDLVYVDMGSAVRRGQMLALIDTTELSQTRGQAAATAQDLENAEATMKVAVAALDIATTRLDYARITAPFSGTITKKFLDPVTVVSALTSTLFTLMDLDRLRRAMGLSVIPGAPAR